MEIQLHDAKSTTNGNTTTPDDGRDEFEDQQFHFPFASNAFLENCVSKHFAPFVTTPPSVVTKSLQFGGVTSDDYAFDLGCGDGRFCFAAASEFGARALGIDIDEELVAECRRRQAAFISEKKHHLNMDLVSFTNANFLDVDTTHATLLIAYLTPSTLNQLKPMFTRFLLAQSASTSSSSSSRKRILTLRYSLDGWTPTKEDPVLKLFMYTKDSIATTTTTTSTTTTTTTTTATTTTTTS